MTLRVFYAGEGRTELGSRAYIKQQQPKIPETGVLEALVCAVAGTPCECVGAKVWKNLPALRPGQGEGAVEQRRVDQLVLLAGEQNADVLVFARDRDGDKAREKSIEQGITNAPKSVRVVGGVAIETIEAWILALKGEHGSEELSNPKEHLKRRHDVDDTQLKAEVVTNANLDRVPEDARSLRLWLERARQHLVPR
ncbi:MAG: hypothetical protein QM784_21885 [Polyangiaceae bacterium]